MSEKVITDNKLNQSDYYDVILIILFSLYTYFFMSEMFTFGDIKILSEAPNIQASRFNIVTIIAPILFMILILYRYWFNDNRFKSKFGFLMNKPCWIQLTIVVVLGVILILNSKTIPTIETLKEVLFYLLNITVTAIIYIVIFIELVLKIFDRFKIKAGIAIIGSGLCFMMLYTYTDSFNIFALMAFIATAHLYYLYKNLLFTIFWNAFMLIPKIDHSLDIDIINKTTKNSFEGGEIAFVVILLFIYFAIAIPVNLLGKGTKTIKT